MSDLALAAAPQATLAAALVCAQQSAQAVGKASKNAFHGYKYASAEAIIVEGREALTSAGLAMLRLSSSLVSEPTQIIGKDDKPVTVEQFVLRATFRLYHVSGQFLDLTADMPVVPEKGRPMDKATSTAGTYLLGYMLRDLLMLPRVDAAEEVDARNDGKPKAENLTPALLASTFEVYLKQIAAAADVPTLTKIHGEMYKSQLSKADKDKLHEQCAVRRKQVETPA